jgi:uncharacterized protein (DUF58 family)
VDDRAPLLDSAFLQQLEQMRFAAPHAITGGMAGDHLSSTRAHAAEFADYRNYVIGDDIRMIDWNVYARLGELCVRLGPTYQNLRVHLLLDCSRSMNWGRPNKLRYAKRVAAALGALALMSYDTVYVGAWHGDLHSASPALRGRQATGELLRYLEGLLPGPATDPARAMASYCAPHRGSGIAVLLTDCMAAAGYAEALTLLAAAGLRTTLLHILDTDEQQPDLEGLLELHDCETGERVKVGITPEVLRHYAARFQAWSEDLATQCTARRASYIQVASHVSPTALILQTLYRQGVLR